MKLTVDLTPDEVRALAGRLDAPDGAWASAEEKITAEAKRIAPEIIRPNDIVINAVVADEDRVEGVVRSVWGEWAWVSWEYDQGPPVVIQTHFLERVGGLA